MYTLTATIIKENCVKSSTPCCFVNKKHSISVILIIFIPRVPKSRCVWESTWVWCPKTEAGEPIQITPNQNVWVWTSSRIFLNSYAEFFMLTYHWLRITNQVNKFSQALSSVIKIVNEYVPWRREFPPCLKPWGGVEVGGWGQWGG